MSESLLVQTELTIYILNNSETLIFFSFFSNFFMSPELENRSGADPNRLQNDIL